MPILNVKVSASKSKEMMSRISPILLELTGRILRKNTKATLIAIEYVDPEDWVVAGKSLAEQGKSSLYFGIKNTDEANIKTEKAQYITEAFEALAQLLRKLHEQSYIYMQDVIATTYGYGGRTQEHRYHQA